jgi:hypothetical protein
MSDTMSQIKPLPGETKDDARRRAQRDVGDSAELEAHQRAYDALMRTKCTHWLFWELCALKRCRRHRACGGDVERCFARFRALVASP